MAILLLRAAGHQSWGTSAKFDVRDTEIFPTKSGIAGMVFAARGIERNEITPEMLSEFFQLEMAVRIDRSGYLLKDFQTVEGMPQISGSTNKTIATTERYYLSDADFLVALKGPKKYLACLDSAFADPEWLLFLGRKCFLPHRPVHVGLRKSNSIMSVFRKETWWRYPDDKDMPARLTVVRESDQGHIVNDICNCYISSQRSFYSRTITFSTIPLTEKMIRRWPPEEE